MSPPGYGKIQVLPEEVSCRIAAGEVVERPASVVKELLENSLDAHSTLITIEVEEGGRRLMRVIDNGEGMRRPDAQLSCQRFATSKLRHEDDLQRLNTLGFRGEALPSIASISRFRLKTIPPDSPVGTEASSNGGVSWEIRDFAGTQGTEIEVRDVFFNTPGRLKFLKSVPTEFSKICYVVQQAALVNPGVHFRLFHQGNKVFEYPTAKTTQDRLLQIYGSSFLERYVQVTHQSPGIQLAGFTVNPHFARNTRSPQEIFVNQRAIKNSTIAHAVQEAYGSFLPKGQQPQYILFLTLDPDSLDVNVHPTKREVRFSRPEIIHNNVRQAIKNIFYAAPARKDFPHPIPESAPKEASQSAQVIHTALSSVSSNTESTVNFPGSPSTRTSLSLFVQEPPAPYVPSQQPPAVYSLGQIHHTYLVGQIDKDLYIIDQHTAHERVLFERLLRNWANRELPKQGLLIPEHLELPSHQQTQLEEWLPLFAQVGLEIERFGQTAFVVRSIPALLGPVSIGPLVLELLDELSEWRSQSSLERTLRPIFATMACQSAVQAGRSMSEPEILTLLQDWAHEQFPMTCPHGRRIALRHSLEELQTLFARPTY